MKIEVDQGPYLNNDSPLTEWPYTYSETKHVWRRGWYMVQMLTRVRWMNQYFSDMNKKFMSNVADSITGKAIFL